MRGMGMRQTKQRNGAVRRLWLFMLLAAMTAGALMISLSACSPSEPPGGIAGDDVQGAQDGQKHSDGQETPAPLSPVQLSILCAGDVMAHETQLKAQYDAVTDTYDFSNNYMYVKKYIEQADLAICNVETTFRGGKPTGYPAFNSPDSLADALKGAGFDIAATANNHMMDTGFDGMQRTLQVLRDAGLTTTGSRFAGEKSYSITDVKGVSVAVVAATYETPVVNGSRTINGNRLSEEARALINSFGYETLDQDLQALKESIADARAAGAQIVVAYLHWGEEYQRSPNDWQQRIAETVAGFGADVIFASHPHVLQPVDYLYVKDDGSVLSAEEAASATDARKVPVFYSLGNFISNQRQETLDNRYTEQGMLAGVELVWDAQNQRISDISMNVLPVWVDRYKVGGTQNYRLIPLDGDMEQNEALGVSGHLQRAKQALEDVRALIGNQFLHDNCPQAQ